MTNDSDSTPCSHSSKVSAVVPDGVIVRVDMDIIEKDTTTTTKNVALPSPPVSTTDVTSWFSFTRQKPKNNAPNPKNVAYPKHCSKSRTSSMPMSVPLPPIDYSTGVINNSPTKAKSQYSIAAWTEYFQQPTGYSTVESKHSNRFKGSA